MFPDYEQKYLPLVFSVPPRRRPDSGPIDPLADNLGQDQGEVWQGIRRQWEGHGGLQQGGRRPQPLKGRCGEAEDELKHQEAADGRQQERVRQPAAENQRASGESDDKYPQDSDLSTIITWLWSGTNWWPDPISPPTWPPQSDAARIYHLLCLEIVRLQSYTNWLRMRNFDFTHTKGASVKVILWFIIARESFYFRNNAGYFTLTLAPPGFRNVGMSQVRFPQSRLITTSSIWISLNNKIRWPRGTRPEYKRDPGYWIHERRWHEPRHSWLSVAREQVKKLRFYWMSCARWTRPDTAHPTLSSTMARSDTELHNAA